MNAYITKLCSLSSNERYIPNFDKFTANFNGYNFLNCFVATQLQSCAKNKKFDCFFFNSEKNKIVSLGGVKIVQMWKPASYLAQMYFIVLLSFKKGLDPPKKSKTASTKISFYQFAPSE